MRFNDTVIKIFNEQVDIMSKHENPEHDHTKCDEKYYKQKNLDHRNAYICVNKILLKLDKEIT